MLSCLISRPPRTTSSSAWRRIVLDALCLARGAGTQGSLRQQDIQSLRQCIKDQKVPREDVRADGPLPVVPACSADDPDGPISTRYFDTTVVAHWASDGTRDLVVQLMHSPDPSTTPLRGQHVHHVTAVARVVGHLLAHDSDLTRTYSSGQLARTEALIACACDLVVRRRLSGEGRTSEGASTSDLGHTRHWALRI